jgi:hypothetical protein
VPVDLPRMAISLIHGSLRWPFTIEPDAAGQCYLTLRCHKNLLSAASGGVEENRLLVCLIKSVATDWRSCRRQKGQHNPTSRP